MFLKIREIHFDFPFAELLPSYPAQMLRSELCKVCKSCISLKMLKNNIKYYPKFSCKNLSRYSRERASRSLGENIQYYSLVSLDLSRLVHGLDGVRQVRELLLVRLVLLLAEPDELLDARGHLRDLALEVRDLRRQRLNLRSVSSTLYPSFVIVSLSI